MSLHSMLASLNNIAGTLLSSPAPKDGTPNCWNVMTKSTMWLLNADHHRPEDIMLYCRMVRLIVSLLTHHPLNSHSISMCANYILLVFLFPDIRIKFVSEILGHDRSMVCRCCQKKKSDFFLKTFWMVFRKEWSNLPDLCTLNAHIQILLDMSGRQQDQNVDLHSVAVNGKVLVHLICPMIRCRTSFHFYTWIRSQQFLNWGYSSKVAY